MAASVSRRHARVWAQGGGWYVIARQALRHNDVIRCGQLQLRFVEDGAERA